MNKAEDKLIPHPLDRCRQMEASCTRASTRATVPLPINVTQSECELTHNVVASRRRSREGEQASERTNKTRRDETRRDDVRYGCRKGLNWIRLNGWRGLGGRARAHLEWPRRRRVNKWPRVARLNRLARPNPSARSRRLSAGVMASRANEDATRMHPHVCS